MRKILWIALIAVAIIPVYTACNPNTNTTTDNQSKTAITDSDLENSIRTKLNSDAQLKAADLEVSADAEKNTATLSGTVESQALRTKAITLAKDTHSGLLITDKIDVKPSEMTRAKYTEDDARNERVKAKDSKDSIGDSIDDASIHMKIVTKLIGDSDTPERKINVDVVNNIVTLRGTVDTVEQKTEAERIAKETDGVKKVNNQLKVSATPSS